MKYLVIAFIIILILALVYWVFISDSRKRKKAEEYYNNSAGGFDENAKRALDQIERLTTRTPADNFRHANIIRYNILEGEVNLRRARDLNTIAEDYTNALMFMDTIPADEARQMVGNMAEFDAETRRLFDDDDLDDVDMLFMVGAFNNAFAELAPNVVENIVDVRMEKAKENAATREDVVDNYFSETIKYTSDPQNVHDSNVNKDLRGTLNRLRRDYTGISPGDAIAQARAYIDTELTGEKKTNAMNTLTTITRGEVISTYGEREDVIFAIVWDRAYHPNNKKNRKSIKDAIVAAVVDCVENGSMVCINGRTSRILNSLTLLDFDTTVGNTMTQEMLRNEIFHEAHTIIKEETERAKASEDAAIRNVGLSYEGEDVSVDPAAEQLFKDEITRQIDMMLINYKDRFSQKEYETIRIECLAPIDV